MLSIVRRRKGGGRLPDRAPRRRAPHRREDRPALRLDPAPPPVLTPAARGLGPVPALGSIPRGLVRPAAPTRHALLHLASRLVALGIARPEDRPETDGFAPGKLVERVVARLGQLEELRPVDAFIQLHPISAGHENHAPIDPDSWPAVDRANRILLTWETGMPVGIEMAPVITALEAAAGVQAAGAVVKALEKALGTEMRVYGWDEFDETLSWQAEMYGDDEDEDGNPVVIPAREEQIPPLARLHRRACSSETAAERITRRVRKEPLRTLALDILDAAQNPSARYDDLFRRRAPAYENDAYSAYIDNFEAYGTPEFGACLAWKEHDPIWAAADAEYEDRMNGGLHNPPLTSAVFDVRRAETILDVCAWIERRAERLAHLNSIIQRVLTFEAPSDPAPPTED